MLSGHGCRRRQRPEEDRPTRCSTPSPTAPAATSCDASGRGALGLALAANYDMSFASVQKHVAVLERRWPAQQTAATAANNYPTARWRRCARSLSMLVELDRPLARPHRSHRRAHRTRIPHYGSSRARHRRHHDLDTRTLTITAEFAAPVERIWQVYAIPGSSRRSSARHPSGHLRRARPDPGGRAHTS